MSIQRAALFAVTLALSVTVFENRSSADILCQKSKDKSLKVVNTSKCPKGFKLVLNTSSFKGADGNNGADGKLGIYGDGSAGPLTISADTDWNSAPPTGNIYEFTNFTVISGVTLFVPSGSIIRCTGTFTNNGTIFVVTGALGSTLDGTLASSILFAGGATSQGVSLRTASFGEIGNNSVGRIGGHGGLGVTSAALSTLLRPGISGGGAGAGSLAATGGSGGGTLTVLAKGGIVNGSTGIIQANGNGGGGAGCGGGGGGIIVLASPASIANTGSISATGGLGGDSNLIIGAGGGGGGGIINFLSPSITPGTTTVAAGTAGTITGSVTNSVREAGSGGGACGGGGGDGGAIASGAVASPAAAADGSSGVVSQTPADPTDLF